MKNLIQEKIYDLEMLIKRQENKIVEKSERLKTLCDSIKHRIKDGSTLNSLGEIQSSGPDLDREIIVLCQLKEELNRLNQLTKGIL